MDLVFSLAEYMDIFCSEAWGYMGPRFKYYCRVKAYSGFVAEFFWIKKIIFLLNFFEPGESYDLRHPSVTRILLGG